MRLNDLSIRSLKSPESGAKIYVCDQVAGFGIRITAAGTASYVLTLPGRNRDRITIGRVGVIALKDARGIAREKLAEITLGKHRPRRMTFEDALTLYVAEKSQKVRASTIKESKRILDKYFPALHAKQLSDITTDDITGITDKLAKTPGTALHAFWSARTFLRWCVRRRYLSHSPIEGLEPPSRVIFRDRVLTDDELRQVLLAAQDAGTFGKLVLALSYTGQRRGEVAALRREWIGVGTITLPADITKNSREHTFPYGSHLAAIIGNFPDTGLLFPSSSGKPWSNFSKAKAALPCDIAPWTLHDLRRTFATGLQRLGIRLEVIEALLNHISGTRAGIVGVYQRHSFMPEMREAVEKWESFLTSLIVPISG